MKTIIVLIVATIFITFACHDHLHFKYEVL